MKKSLRDRKLPPGPRIPHQPNPTFVGREETLEHLWNNLKPEDSTVVALVGIGGSGKTQITVEYCYRYYHLYDQIHWLQVEQGRTDEIVRCASPETGVEEDTPSEIFDQTLASWNRNHLVVLDNVSSGEKGLSLLEEWLPRMSHANVLITTRREDWPNELKITSIRVDMFSAKTSKALLEKLAPRTKSSPKDQVNILLERLGYLPLAIDLAGRNLAGKIELGVGDYLQELNECECILQHESLTGWRESNPTQHTTNVANTYLSSWFEVKDKIPQNMYRCLGYFAPNTPIPYSLLERLLSVDEETLREAVTRLSQKGLLYREDTGVVLPEVLINFSRSLDLQMAKSLLPYLAEKVAQVIEKTIENGEFKNQTEREIKINGHHIKYMASDVYSAGHMGGAVKLFHLLGGLNYAEKKFKIAEEYFQLTLTILEDSFGPDTNAIREPLKWLSFVNMKMGDYETAKETSERWIKFLSKIDGPYHEELLLPLGIMVKVNNKLGKMECVLETKKRIIEIKEAKYGTNHLKMLGALRSLGQTLAELKNLDGLKQTYRKAFIIWFEDKQQKLRLKSSNEIFLVDFQRTLWDATSDDIGVWLIEKELNSLGGIESIKAVHKQIYESYLSTYGQKDPILLALLVNFGRRFNKKIYFGISDYYAAKQAYKKAIELIEETFPGHPLEKELYREWAEVKK